MATSRRRRALALGLIVASLGVVPQLARASSSYLIISRSVQGTWSKDSANCLAGGPTGSVTFVNGPATPPGNVGSLRYLVGSDGNSMQMFRDTEFAGMKLSALTALSYNTYQSSFVDSQAVYLQIDVDWNNDGGQDDTIFFEPAYSGPVSINTWQGWDALSGGWWSNNDPTLGPGIDVKTIAYYVGRHPNARIVNPGGEGGLRITAGCGAGAWDNFDGNADMLTIGTASNITTYDFEVTGAAPIIKTPLAGATSRKLVTFTGFSDPFATVILYEGDQLEYTIANGNGGWSMNVNMQGGQHGVYAVAINGNASSPPSSTRSFFVDAIAPPAPKITSPAASSLQAGRTVVSGTTEAFATVEVFDGIRSAGKTVADPLGAWSAPFDLSPTGQHTIVAKATDAYENTSPASASVTFSVDATDPSVTVAQPSTPIMIRAMASEVSGTATDNIGVVKVMVEWFNPFGVLMERDTALCPSCGGASTSTEWSASITTNLLPGPYTLVVTATDEVGNLTDPPSTTTVVLV